MNHRRGLVDKVLTRSIVWFERNAKECPAAIRELKALGIGVVFEENGISTAAMCGEMMKCCPAFFIDRNHILEAR